MTRSFWTRAALGLVLAAGCTDLEDEPGGHDEAAQTGADGLDRTPRGVFERNARWDKDELVVCFDDDTYDDPTLVQARQWVIDGATPWESISRIRFSYWGRCSDVTAPDISITDTSSSYSQSEIGIDSRDVYPSMLINMRCFVTDSCLQTGSPKGMCNTNGGSGPAENEPGAPPPSKAPCVRATSGHEFGHALGLRHEQAHPDATCSIKEPLDTQGYSGLPVFAYDPGSIMNYCSPATKPSLGDVTTINTIYPQGVVLYHGADFTDGTQILGAGKGFTLAWNPRSIIVPPGHSATLCTTTTCHVYTTSATSLAYNYVKADVSLHVLAHKDLGYRGALRRLGVGLHKASTGALSPIGGNAISSMYVPAGLRVYAADLEGGTTLLYRSVVEEDPHASLLGMDNLLSQIEVVARVVGHEESAFRGKARVLATGTYRVNAGHTWLPKLASITIGPGLDVRACTAESPIGGEAGTCVTLVNSGSLPTGITHNVRYLKVRVLAIAIPPPPTN